MTEEERYQHSRAPMEYIDAVAASRAAGEAQRAAEQFVVDASRQLADAERAYRERLSTRITELRGEGVAVTAAGDIARGEPRIAALRHMRDVKQGLVEAAKQGTFRHMADRRDCLEFIEWSKRVSFLDAAQDYDPQRMVGAR